MLNALDFGINKTFSLVVTLAVKWVGKNDDSGRTVDEIMGGVQGWGVQRKLGDGNRKLGDGNKKGEVE